MGITTEQLVEYTAEFLPDLDIEKLEVYKNELIERNKNVNLTAITEPREINEKHFLDCLSVFRFIDFKKNATVIDVGTGAGFPGLVLKTAREDLSVTLLDSLNKRLLFLDDVCRKNNLSCNIVHARAEDGARGELRESFDYAVSRAVARLPVLLEYCLPYVKKGGSFIALKGPETDEEIRESETAFKTLGGEIGNVFRFSLPSGDRRTLIEVKKTSQTPSIYPRKGVKITKKPL